MQHEAIKACSREISSGKEYNNIASKSNETRDCSSNSLNTPLVDVGVASWGERNEDTTIQGFIYSMPCS